MDEKKTKYFKGRVKSVNAEEFTAEVVISDETIDRYNERVLASSFKKTIRDFMRHPILLSSHAYRGLMNQIGMFTKIKIEDNEVVGFIKIFVGAGNAEADWAWVLLEKGVAAFSIGFIPKKYRRIEDAKDSEPDLEFEEIELLEVSQVLIPANPSALQRSFDDPLIKDLAEGVVALFKEHPEEITWEDEELSEEEKDLDEEEVEEVEEKDLEEEEESIEDLSITAELIEAKNYEESFSEINDKIDSLAKEIFEIKELLKAKEETEIEEEDNEETKESDATETSIKEVEEEEIEMDEIFGEEKLAELKNVLFMGKSCDNNETDAIKKFFTDATQELKGIFSEPQS